jgi:hypothetical protein
VFPNRRVWRKIVAWAALSWSAHPAAAITLSVDYTYDLPGNGGSNFFGSGNPQGATAGAQAKAALDAAANYYSTILTDSFSVIQTPAQFHSSQFDGVWTWQWKEMFNSPGTNSAVVVTDPTVAVDQYVIYASARSLSGSTAGFGGPGGFSWSSTPTGTFTQQEIDQCNGTTANFQSEVEKRGQASGFTRWGGTITFDNDGSTTWFFNHLGTPSGNVADFYSVAIHELGHSFGFGASSEWQALVSGSNFIGANSEAQNNGNPVPLSPDLGHWVSGKQSVVYGSSTPQEAVMDPDLQNGTRKRLTGLDAAGLKDIGWSLGPAPSVDGDYNNNGKVDAADYVAWRKRNNQSVLLPNDITPGTVSPSDYSVWRTNYFNSVSGSGSGTMLASGDVPEPASGLLAIFIGLATFYMRFTCGA